MNLEKEIIEVIAERLGLSPEEISKGASLTYDLNASRLEITDLFLALEEKFRLKIPEEEIGNLQKVGDLVNYVLEHFDEPSTL